MVINLSLSGVASAVQADTQDIMSGPQTSKRWADEYARTSRTLYRLLASPGMQSRARAPFLRQLLLRLNFNDFLQQDIAKRCESQKP